MQYVTRPIPGYSLKTGKMLPVKLPLTSRELKIDLICGINYEL
jgi:hypothetical protein